MNILVTGATGFIGSRLVQRLIPDHTVFCLNRRTSTRPMHPQVRVITQDLSETLDPGRLPSSMDAIIHLAQSRHFRKFPEQARDIYQVNTAFTHQLLEYGRQAKIRVFVLASSGGVCGYQPRPILETDPPALINFYLASKYAAECLVAPYSDFFATAILRYFFVYGDGQRDMFMPGLVARVLQGTPVIISGKTGITMNPIYVSDAVEATVRALGTERQEIFNVAGAESVTILELAGLIGQLAGRQPVLAHEPEKGPSAMVANIEKMKLKLGLSPQVSIKEGLDRLVKDVLRTAGGSAR